MAIVKPMTSSPEGLLWLRLTDQNSVFEVFPPRYQAVPEVLHIVLDYGYNIQENPDVQKMVKEGEEFRILVGPNSWDHDIQALPVEFLNRKDNKKDQWINGFFARKPKVPHVVVSSVPGVDMAYGHTMLRCPHMVAGRNFYLPTTGVLGHGFIETGVRVSFKPFRSEATKSKYYY